MTPAVTASRSAARSTAATAAALALAALLAPMRGAHAGDDGDGTAPEGDVVLDGAVRAGWRLLSGRGRGRFLEDVDLDGGPRIFDLDARLRDLREDAYFDEIEVRASDLGERSSDASVVARGANGTRLEGGYTRDLFSYRADGDPFPRDTTRERSYARVRLTPQRGLSLRLGWDRSARRGEAFAEQRTTLREFPAPPGVDREIVSTVRDFDERFDTFTLGVDASTGPWRYGVTASLRHGRVDDERRYDVPPERRGGAPVSEDFRRRVTSDATTVVGKVGRTFLGDAAEATLFVSETWLPVDADLRSDATGFDNAFSGAAPRGAFTSRTTGTNEVDRRASSWELEGSWQVLDALEFLASGGQETLIDDARLDVVERRRYERAGVANAEIVTSRRGRTTNRIDRASIEALFDAADDVQLRAGYEWFAQNTKAPFETRGDALEGSTLSSEVHRWIAGIDVRPAPGLSASVLARVARDDAPPATPSFESADEVSARVRWRAGERLSLLAAHRYRGLRHRDRLDSVTRSGSTSLRATWSDGALTLDGGATRQTIHTESDTRFLILDGIAFRRVATEVTYDTRDVVLDALATYEIAPRVRISGGGHHVQSSGDEELTAYQAFATFEVDVSKTVTLGLTGRIWRYDERRRSIDDYDAEALEAWLELRF